MRAEAELQNPHLYAQINKDIEDRVQTFTGDNAASNPSRLSVGEPVKSVFDVSNLQRTGVRFLDTQTHAAASSHIITIDAFNDANTSGKLLEKINAASAWEISEVTGLWSVNGALAADCWIYGTYAVAGSTPNVILYQHHMLPGFAFSTRGFDLPMYSKGQNFGRDFMIMADDTADATGEVLSGNLIALVATFAVQAGTQTFTISNFSLNINLYH